MRAARKSSSNFRGHAPSSERHNRPEFSPANMVALATILMQVVAKATTFSRDFNQDENIVAIGGAISEITENSYS
ncbi:MAG: hypothetical protein ACYCPM_12470 [Acidobacteriaceae bacterium]